MRKIILISTLVLAACGAGNKGSNSHLFDDQGSGSGSGSAAEVPKADLIASFVGDALVANGKITFALEFKNVGGAMTVEVPVKSKAMLFPRLDFAHRLAAKGVVLETLETKLLLGVGESKVVTFEKTLPSVPKADYFLGATINTDASAFPQEATNTHGPIFFEPPHPVIHPVDVQHPEDQAEAGSGSAALPAHLEESVDGQLNNVTAKLLDLGNVEVVLAPAALPHGKYDLGHEVQNASIALDAGTASHSSRNILRIMEGDDVLPPRTEWGETISARFLFADLDHGTLAMGAYEQQTVDKVWTGISYQPEKDAAGHNIYVDYYSNAPVISALVPGHYVMGVLMNVNDQFKLDSYPDNNLDLTNFNLSTQQIIKLQDEVWMSVNDGTSANISASINDRGDLHNWTYSIENAPSWLTVTPKTNRYNYNLTLKADALHVPLGMNQIDIKITAQKDGQKFEAVTTVKVFKNGGPVLEVIGVPQNNMVRLDTPGLTITDTDGVKTLHYSVTIQNSGTEKLYYTPKKDSPALQIDVEGNGKMELAPGEMQVLKLTLPMVGTPIPRDDGTTRTYFGFEMMSNGGERYVELYLEQGVPGSGGGGDDHG